MQRTTFKLNKLSAIFLSILALLISASNAFATPISPGTTLDPSCTPTTADCYVTPMNIGGTINSATLGSLLFAGTGGILAQDNSNLFWDDTNNYLGVGTATPSAGLEVVGDIVSKGTKWTEISSVPTPGVAQYAGWGNVAYGNGLFVAANYASSGNRIMTSPDGVNWTARTVPGSSKWSAITYGNGLFVATAAWGGADKVVTSPDGITWTERNAASSYPWQDIAYGNGTFVAVSYSGNGNSLAVMTSYNGVNWTSRDTGSTPNAWYGITYGNGQFVVVGSYESAGVVMTSPDGITWTLRTSAASRNWHAVTYGNGIYVAVNWDGGTTDSVMTSPDGITWTTRTAPYTGWDEVIYGNGLFVATGGSETGHGIMTSPDGINWTARTTPVGNHATDDTAYGNGVFVMVGGTDVLVSGKMNELAFSANNTYSADLTVNRLTIGKGLGSDFASTAFGYNTLAVNTTGGQNTGVGYGTLSSNTTGGQHVAIGVNALANNTTGDYNTATGHNSMITNTSGGYNTSIGQDALYYNTTGARNVSLGNFSLKTNTTGVNNVALGYSAGTNGSGWSSGATGAYTGNISLGFQAGNNITDGANYNITIGYDIDLPIAGGSNQLTIGNILYGTTIDGTGTTVSTGKIGIGDATPDYRFDIDADVASYASGIFNDGNATTRSGLYIQAGLDDHTAAGPSTLIGFADGDGTAVGSITFGSSATAYNTTSDQRLKNLVNEETSAVSLQTLRDIKIHDFTWKDDVNNTLYTGVFAQELYNVYPHAVTKPVDEATDNWMVDYSKLVPVTIAGIKGLDTKITDIENLNPESTFVTKLKEWLASATNGIDSLFAKNIKTENIETEKLCFKNGVCVTGEQVQQLLNNANIESSEPVIEEVITNEESNQVEENPVVDEASATETEASELPVAEETPVQIPESISNDNSSGLIIE